MDKGIEPALQERIRSLCKQVTVAYDLDAEIQEELYGHMEDKLLAYLAGEEKLSNEDAFILMREHFGNPEALKEILQAVHEPSEEETGMRVSLPRRLTAALVASMVIGVPTGLVWSLAQLGLALWSVHTDSPGTVALARILLLMGIPIIALLVNWKLLLKWQQQLTQGRELWLLRWPAHWMWAAFGAALVVPQFIPQVFVTGNFAQQQFPGATPAGVLSVLAIMMALQATNAMLWLWWSDRPPRTGRKLQRTFLSLVALELFRFLCPRAVPSLLLSTGGTDSIESLTLASGTLFDAKSHWSLAWGVGEFWSSTGTNGQPSHLLATIAFQFAAIVGVMLLGYGAYILARRIQGRMTRRHTPGQAVA